MKLSIKKNLLLIAGIAISASAFAQSQGAGNGGNGIVCFSDPKIAVALTTNQAIVIKTIPDQYLPFITSIETLDYHEAKRAQGLDQSIPVLRTMNPNETPEQFVSRLLESYGAVIKEDDYPFSSEVRRTLVSIAEIGKNSFKTIQILPDAGVFPAQDIQPLAHAQTGCVYTTLAIQRSVGKSKRELVIDGRLFNDAGKKNSELSKATLILHEYILAAELTMNSNSASAELTEGVRELVSAMLRNNSTLETLIEIINRRGLFDHGYSRTILLTELESVLAKFNENHQKIKLQLIHENEDAFIQAAQSHYNRLPKWYHEKYKLTDTNPIRCGNVIENGDNCMNNRQTEQFDAMTKKIEEVYAKVILPKLQARLKEELPQRLEALSAAFTSLRSRPFVVNPDQLEKIERILFQDTEVTLFQFRVRVRVQSGIFTIFIERPFGFFYTGAKQEVSVEINGSQVTPRQ